MSRNTLEYYLNLKYHVILEQEEFEEEKWYLAYTDELGKYACYGKAESAGEAFEFFEEEKNVFIKYLFDTGKPIPEPLAEVPEDFSGVFSVRTSPLIHANLSQQARRLGVSLNQYINQILSAGATNQGLSEDVVEHMKLFCSKLDDHHKQVTTELVRFSPGNLGSEKSPTIWSEDSYYRALA